jgi:hypothetical protein
MADNLPRPVPQVVRDKPRINPIQQPDGYGRLLFQRDPAKAAQSLKKYLAVVVVDGKDFSRLADRININLGPPAVDAVISEEGYGNLIIPFINEYEILLVQGDEREPIHPVRY